MQNKEERKVLLQISNLKQYFPVGKKGLFVKANDGISIDIYEGCLLYTSDAADE